MAEKGCEKPAKANSVLLMDEPEFTGPCRKSKLFPNTAGKGGCRYPKIFYGYFFAREFNLDWTKKIMKGYCEMKLPGYIKTVALIVAIMLVAATASAQAPKFVFFFLGDGMSSSQIQAAEAYLTTFNGNSATKADDLLKSENRLNMSKMPVLGMQTTYDAYALMTDSASSATAFACGLKTKSGVIGKYPDPSQNGEYKKIKSIAQLAKEAGMKVGVLSSVSLDHATPAAYYASVDSRNNYAEIDEQMALSGYEFFGGGGLKIITHEEMETKYGYQVLNTKEEMLDLKHDIDKVVCINPWLQDSDAMPYAIDKPSDNLSLAEMTEVAIEFLYGKNSENGFFIMVEGGKIDWACHANDAVATIGDLLDFDAAVGKALDFYKDHPEDTLVVVTGDHETGGMSIGHATTAYTAYYDRLLDQKNSFQFFGDNQWADYKAVNSERVCRGNSHLHLDNLEREAEMVGLMKDVFGLDYSQLNDFQKEKLEDAFDKSLCGANDNSDAENKLLYGGYEPIVVTITHILNENASIGWTSYSHTGVPVPVFAQGKGEENFAGFYDNTDIAKKLAAVMAVGTLPAEK